MAENERELILSRILQLAGIDHVDMDNFDNRLVYQKIVYLMQNYGLSLGYGYSWYVKGPYSPELTKTLFNITPQISAESANFVFDDNDSIIEKVTNFKSLLNDQIRNPLFLEILASIIFIQKSSQIRDNTSVKKELLRLKPKLEENPAFEITFNSAFGLAPKFSY